MDRQIKDDVHLCYTAFQPLPSVDNVHGLRFWTAHVIFSTEDVGTTAEDGVGLEHHGAAAALQEVLARGQAAHAGADDGHPLLVHDHTALAGLVGIGSARETTRAVAVG